MVDTPQSRHPATNESTHPLLNQQAQPSFTFNSELATIFEHFDERCGGRIAPPLSHSFSTVRMTDQKDGSIIERGNHEQLMAEDGHYAHSFLLQAQGYR